MTMVLHSKSDDWKHHEIPGGVTIHNDRLGTCKIEQFLRFGLVEGYRLGKRVQSLTRVSLVVIRRL